MTTGTAPPFTYNIHLFHCANSLDLDALRQCCTDLKAVQLTPISLPCSGKAELIYLLKAFETGADGALLVTCPVDCCRYLEGNLRARKRTAAVAALLAEIGLNGRRVQTIAYDPERGAALIKARIEELCAILQTDVPPPGPVFDLKGSDPSGSNLKSSDLSNELRSYRHGS